MLEKWLTGTLKRYKNLIVLIAVVVLLIIIVIITANRMISRMEYDSFGHSLSYPPGELYHPVTTSFHSQ